MRVSVLTPDLSSNCLGRAHLLAKILQRRYDVEIVGPVLGDGIWGPLAGDASMTYVPVETSRRGGHYRLLGDTMRKITGDVVYASKPLFHSFDVGLLTKILAGRPLVLDIDDWEMGFQINCSEGPYSALRRVRHAPGRLRDFVFRPADSVWWMACNEKFVRFADEVTVSGRFLKRKFGGTIIWHARSASELDPEEFDRNSLRHKYGIGVDRKVVLFCGTPRPHKGVEDLIAAMKRVPEAVFMIVGVDGREYCQRLIEAAREDLGRERVVPFGIQTFSNIRDYLAMSDIVVIPQRRNQNTIGQVPAKVFDAMAMAKPTIVTDVSDLAEIVGDCGWVTEAENPEELAGAMTYVLDHPREAQERGIAARRRFEAEYSDDAMEGALCGLFNKYDKR